MTRPTPHPASTTDAAKRHAEATPDRAEQGDGLEAVLVDVWQRGLIFKPGGQVDLGPLAAAVRAHYAEQAEAVEGALAGIEAEADLASRAGQRARLLHMVATARAALRGPR